MGTPNEFQTIKIWKKTLRSLKMIAALTDSSLVETMDRLASRELARLQKKGKKRMTIHEALNETGVAEATINNLVYTVKDDQADFSPTESDGEPNDPNDYVLTIANGMMPPHVTKSYASISLIEQEYPGLDWSATEMDI